MTKPSILDQLRQARTAAEVVPDAAPVVPLNPLVGIYARISDAYEGKDTGITDQGVQRQLGINRTLAEARGWEIHKEYVDNDVSAFKAGVVRDAFEELLDDLEAGVIVGIVCYNLDRFARQVHDLERAIAIFDRARREDQQLYFATAEGDLNLASDDGLTMARVMVAFANKSSRDTARRVALKHREIRDRGDAVGGRRPFGWDWVRDEVALPDGTVHYGRRYNALNEDEAAHIRRAAAGLTDGSMSWGDVVRDWNERGVLTPTGKQWLPVTVKQVMRNPRLAGWLVHKGAIATHSQTGRLIRAKAPAILSDDEYEALLVAVTPAESQYSSSSGRARYLLAGIIRCAECGARLTGNMHREGRFYYACRRSEHTPSGTAACGQVTASGAAMDRLVTNLVLPRLIEETKGAAALIERPHEAELFELQTQKDQLLAAFHGGEATSELVFPKVRQLEGRIDLLRREQSIWARDQRVLTKGVGISSRESWDALETATQRLHLQRHIDAIYVSRAKRSGGPKFDVERVSPPVWRLRDTDAEPLDAAR